jgi:hypothetical protein
MDSSLTQTFVRAQFCVPQPSVQFGVFTRNVSGANTKYIEMFPSASQHTNTYTVRTSVYITCVTERENTIRQGALRCNKGYTKPFHIPAAEHIILPSSRLPHSTCWFPTVKYDPVLKCPPYKGRQIATQLLYARSLREHEFSNFSFKSFLF